MEANLINSATSVIVLHEIYGVNQHIINAAHKFRNAGYDSCCPDLLGLNRPFLYHEQQKAYKYFIDKIGFAEAALQVQALSAREKSKGYESVILCGYSIGATIAWLCSQDKNVAGVIGFYGSRIRDYLHITPQCPALLVFPTQEKAYDVQSFAGSIKKDNVKVHVLEGSHGFADPFSSEYNPSSCFKTDLLVKNFMESFIK
ncbi:MAG: DeoR family transcriptional regulator [Eubacterium sp.]|nr:DeoR family transcriptional regulator [Eubacterium sp.]